MLVDVSVSCQYSVISLSLSALPETSSFVQEYRAENTHEEKEDA